MAERKTATMMSFSIERDWEHYPHERDGETTVVVSARFAEFSDKLIRRTTYTQEFLDDAGWQKVLEIQRIECQREADARLNGDDA